MTTTNDDPKRIFRFRLRSFKKNNADLELEISARTIIDAWVEARRRSYGFQYYLLAIVTTSKTPIKKQPTRTAPKKLINH